MAFTPVTVLNAGQNGWRSFVKHWEMYIALSGVDGEEEYFGKISDENDVLSLAQTYNDMTSGGKVVKTLPASLNFSFAGRILEDGNAALMSVLAGTAELDDTLEVGYSAIGIGSEPPTPKYYFVKLVGEMDDGREVLVKMWRAQFKVENLQLAGGSTTGTEFQIMAQEDSTQDAAISRGYIAFEDVPV